MLNKIFAERSCCQLKHFSANLQKKFELLFATTVCIGKIISMNCHIFAWETFDFEVVIYFEFVSNSAYYVANATFCASTFAC